MAMKARASMVFVPATLLAAFAEEFMSLPKQQIVSAQVVLRSASGRIPDGTSIITSETIRDFMPSGETVARVRDALIALGFDAGTMVGNNFAISAPVDTFEKVFKTHLRRQEGGGVVSVKDDGSESYELSLEGLPPSIRNLIVAVTFVAPPDFGLTKFGL
jgi:hypothetical protein